MNAERRDMALAVLDLLAGNQPDEMLAATLVTQETATEAMAYLAGFAVEALSLQRGESVPDTVAFLRRALGDTDGGGGGLSGVREPPRPHPSSGGAAAKAGRE